MDPFVSELLPGSLDWGTEVIVVHPRNFEAVQEAVLALRDHATVLLNFSGLPPEQMQRAVDFMAGAAFALDGQQERLGERVFLFAPHFVQLRRDDPAS